MAFPRNEQGPPRFTSVLLFGNLHLENCFEDNGIGGRQVLDLLVLEDNVFQLCLSQRSNRGKCLSVGRRRPSAVSLQRSPLA